MKTDYQKLLELVRSNGMDYKWSNMFVKKLADDEAAFSVDEDTKLWALERGFFPGRVELYGLNESNYRDFLPDFAYFMIHPINHHFRIWINDKLTLKYMLNSCGGESVMPEYYLYVENNGEYTYLMDAPAWVARDRDFLWNMLKEKKILAVKPNSGTSGGRGFMKWERKDGGILINNQPVSPEEFGAVTEKLENHVVTQYCCQHDSLARIWPGSECTLRVIMAKLPRNAKEESAQWQCIGSFARFGASVSGTASNLSAGGIGVGFDYETGKLKNYGIRYKKFCPDGQTICLEHPDSHVCWEECSLPNWQYAKGMIEKVCDHLGSLDYLGLDVILTEDGMKLCEINSHPAVDYGQVICNPVLAEEKNREFFKKHGLFDVDCGKFREIYEKCRV